MNVNDLTILRNEFSLLESEHFKVVNKYIMGVIEVSDIEHFKVCLERFRNKLYSIETNDENIMEIAKMKSKVQHYNTEVLEDEDFLRMAYGNVN